MQIATQDLFRLIQEKTERMFLMRVSYLEIYQEEIRDLLNPENTNMQVRLCVLERVCVYACALVCFVVSARACASGHSKRYLPLTNCLRCSVGGLIGTKVVFGRAGDGGVQKSPLRCRRERKIERWEHFTHLRYFCATGFFPLPFTSHRQESTRISDYLPCSAFVPSGSRLSCLCFRSAHSGCRACGTVYRSEMGRAIVEKLLGGRLSCRMLPLQGAGEGVYHSLIVGVPSPSTVTIHMVTPTRVESYGKHGQAHRHQKKRCTRLHVVGATARQQRVTTLIACSTRWQRHLQGQLRCRRTAPKTAAIGPCLTRRGIFAKKFSVTLAMTDGTTSPLTLYALTHQARNIYCVRWPFRWYRMPQARLTRTSMPLVLT